MSDSMAGSPDTKTHGPITDLTSQQIETEIDRTVIPRVRLKNATFQEALAYVIQVGTELHPEPPFPFPFEVRCKIPEVPMISISENDMPYRELISRLCSEAGVTWRVEKGLIVIE